MGGGRLSNVIGADKFINELKDEHQKLHATQRYEIGISDIDMWNFDVFFADVIVHACNWHMSCGETSPWHLQTDEWHRVLTVIRDGFAKRNDFDVPEPPEEAWQLLKDNFKHFWD